MSLEVAFVLKWCHSDLISFHWCSPFQMQHCFLWLFDTQDFLMWVQISQQFKLWQQRWSHPTQVFYIYQLYDKWLDLFQNVCQLNNFTVIPHSYKRSLFIVHCASPCSILVIWDLGYLHFRRVSISILLQTSLVSSDLWKLVFWCWNLDEKIDKCWKCMIRMCMKGS